MRPGDRLWCAFIEPQNSGDSFNAWPLHVTLVPWFRVAAPNDVLAAATQQAIAGVDPFTFTIGQETMFGHNASKGANIVKPPTPFSDLERRLRLLLAERGAWIIGGHRTYRPHVTVQAARRVHAGEHYWCDACYLVEQKGGGVKQVAAKVMLGHD